MAETKRSQLLFPLMESICIVAACWVAAMLGPLSYLIPILLLLGIVRMLHARAWPMLPFILFLSPLAFAIFLGVYDYLKGCPYLVGMGLPGTEYANIDRTTRCLRASGGCVIRGNEWVFQWPHNFAVRTLALTLGPPKGTYDGPYPTREEALKAVVGGTPIKPGTFASGRIEVAGKTIQLNTSIATEILMQCLPIFWYPELDDESEFSGQLSTTLWQERCLILHWKGELLLKEEIGEVVVLIDTESSRPFAIYELTPGSVRGRAVIGRFWR